MLINVYKEYGRGSNILVNNSGIGGFGKLLDTDRGNAGKIISACIIFSGSSIIIRHVEKRELQSITSRDETGSSARGIIMFD